MREKTVHHRREARHPNLDAVHLAVPGAINRPMSGPVVDCVWATGATGYWFVSTDWDKVTCKRCIKRGSRR